MWERGGQGTGGPVERTAGLSEAVEGWGRHSGATGRRARLEQHNFAPWGLGVQVPECTENGLYSVPLALDETARERHGALALLPYARPARGMSKAGTQRVLAAWITDAVY